MNNNEIYKNNYNNEQLLHLGFVLSRIIKVEVGVIGLSLLLRRPTEDLFCGTSFPQRLENCVV